MFSSLPGAAMAPSYNAMVVAVSFLIASLASFVSLGLARRIQHSAFTMGRLWWGCGALVMGTGIWAMHFVGMQAVQLPITLGYDGPLTLLSWAAAVLMATVALGIAAAPRVQGWRWWMAALVMGCGIGCMHYLGMCAIDMSIPITWDPLLVVLSLGVCVLASAAGLVMFRTMQRLEGKVLHVFQTLAALIMAVAICAMHYIGMAAASFAEGAVCLTADALSGPELTVMITITTTLLLVGTLLAQVLDARFQSTAARLNHSLRASNAQLHVVNEELRQRAFADPLTQLPNRLLLEDRLRSALARVSRSNHRGVKEHLAILFVDLDGFKPINDSFGHAAGDEVLLGVAQRLKDQSRASDTVARVGGDEFLLLLEDVHSMDDCAQVAQRVLQALQAPFIVMDKQMHISGSIGVAAWPEHGSVTPEQLIAYADAAMYEAKRKGGNNYVLFEPHMGKDSLEQMELQNDLRCALAHNQIAMHYQPKVDARSGHLAGVEALMRWQHPQRGMISPAVFIPLAERSGMIQALGQWAIEETCRQLGAWARQGLMVRAAINISVQQLRTSDLAAHMANAIRENGLRPQQVLCEITESVAMEDTQTTQRALQQLREVGVSLSIDDFGTGYSSLSYLRQLQAQQLKIDQSFIKDVQNSEAARAVVQAVVHLAHALGLRVVAEGVENAAQRDILLAMSCDEFQGFFFAPPMSAACLAQWVMEHQGSNASVASERLLRPHWLA